MKSRVSTCPYCYQNIEIGYLGDHMLKKHREIVSESIQYCDCLCHSSKTVDHIAPCCSKCPYCDDNIVFGLYKHIKEVHPNKG